MLTADGALNGPEAVAWGEWFQGLFADGYASNGGTIGNQEFVDGDVALSYTGVWNALASVDAIGDDLLILPPPDFGDGPKIGGGSWQWGISSSLRRRGRCPRVPRVQLQGRVHHRSSRTPRS